MSRMVIFFLGIVAPAFALCLALLGFETLGTNSLGWILIAIGIAFRKCQSQFEC